MPYRRIRHSGLAQPTQYDESSKPCRYALSLLTVIAVIVSSSEIEAQSQVFSCDEFTEVTTTSSTDSVNGKKSTEQPAVQLEVVLDRSTSVAEIDGIEDFYRELIDDLTTGDDEVASAVSSDSRAFLVPGKKMPGNCCATVDDRADEVEIRLLDQVDPAQLSPFWRNGFTPLVDVYPYLEQNSGDDDLAPQLTILVSDGVATAWNEQRECIEQKDFFGEQYDAEFGDGNWLIVLSLPYDEPDGGNWCDDFERVELPVSNEPHHTFLDAEIDPWGNLDLEKTLRALRAEIEKKIETVSDPEDKESERIIRFHSTPDTFAYVGVLGNASGFHCTGVLVGESAVLTARHCLPVTRVRFGHDVRTSQRDLEVVDADSHPDRDVDAALLHLSESVDFRPPSLRREDQASMPPVGPIKAVGFGAIESTGQFGFGRKRTREMTASGWGCDNVHRARQTGCRPGWEMLLPGRGGVDTCDGDSGGPLLELVEYTAESHTEFSPIEQEMATGITERGHRPCKWRLLAIVSRPVATARRRCGHGGIYQRVDRIEPWIHQIMEGGK